MKTTVKTIVKEYDNEGRLVKETETTSEYDNYMYPNYPYQPWNPYYIAADSSGNVYYKSQQGATGGSK